MARKYYTPWLLYVYLLIHGLMAPIKILAIIDYRLERNKIAKGLFIFKILLLFMPHLPADMFFKSLENGSAY